MTVAGEGEARVRCWLRLGGDEGQGQTAFYCVTDGVSRLLAQGLAPVCPARAP